MTTKETAAEVLPQVEKPKENSAQRDAKALRAELGRLVDELMTGEVPLRRMGAALFAVHMGVELGRDKAARMKPAEVQKYAADFRARYPGAWGAVSTANAILFLRHLKIGGFETDPLEDYRKAMSVLAS